MKREACLKWVANCTLVEHNLQKIWRVLFSWKPVLIFALLPYYRRLMINPTHLQILTYSQTITVESSPPTCSDLFLWLIWKVKLFNELPTKKITDLMDFWYFCFVHLFVSLPGTCAVSTFLRKIERLDYWKRLHYWNKKIFPGIYFWKEKKIFLLGNLFLQLRRNVFFLHKIAFRRFAINPLKPTTILPLKSFTTNMTTKLCN